MRGLRVVIVDDAPYVSWQGRVHAVNATFHRFAAALLDVREADGAPAVERVVLAAPVRPAVTAPPTLPVDARVRVVATEPFDGIAGYLRHAPRMTATNLPRLRAAVAGADVALLRLPASNGLLAAFVSAARGIPRVAYVVGSVRDVVAGQERHGAGGLAARAAGAWYDAATRIAGIRATRIVVGADPAAGGIVSSLVLPSEIRDRQGEPWPAGPGVLRLVYAGRLAPGKGLEDLLAAVALQAAGDGPEIRLDLVGDGPEAAALASRAAALGIGHRVRFLGHVAEREPYLRLLAAADLFVTASPAEGFPKAVLDAMAAGLPVIAVPAGRLADLAADGATAHGAAILPVRAGDPRSLADAVGRLAADPGWAMRLRAAGTAFASSHTLPAEAARLAAALRGAAGRGRSQGVS
ncbi:MAG TPA: glycosyltransferase [Candidatus Limnocylindrales bacterium]|nr:glycosyltransferase [Candidatus Limnocylindrales bacterium]